MTNAPEKASQELVELMQKKARGKMTYDSFIFKFYSVMTDDPGRWLNHQPLNIVDDDYVVISLEDYTKKFEFKFQENLSAALFLKKSADDLRDKKLETLAEMFEKPLFRFYAWFARYNINIREYAQRNVNRYLTNLSSRFRLRVKIEKDKRKGQFPRFKHYDLRTNDYELYEN